MPTSTGTKLWLSSRQKNAPQRLQLPVAGSLGCVGHAAASDMAASA